MEIPEYIEGIPTEKKRSKERFALINKIEIKQKSQSCNPLPL